MKHLFILGCHRSGTTMLQQALNRHSQIAIPAETKYFSSFLGHSRNCQLRRLARINKDLRINLPPPPRVVRGKADARAFFDQMGQEYLKRIGKPDIVYFGEKTPAHSGYVPRIQQLFPDAKYVWIYRDGRDVALSMRTVPWMSHNLLVNFMIWLFYYRHQLRAARDKTLDVLFVKYEDLVTQPVSELGRVLDFLGVRYEPAVAKGHGNSEGILEWEYPWKGLALHPITADRIEVWREQLTQEEIATLEWLGGSALRSLGYQLATKGRPPFRLFLYLRLLLATMRFLGRLPLDEAANQLFGRALCFGD